MRKNKSAAKSKAKPKSANTAKSPKSAKSAAKPKSVATKAKTVAKTKVIAKPKAAAKSAKTKLAAKPVLKLVGKAAAKSAARSTSQSKAQAAAKLPLKPAVKKSAQVMANMFTPLDDRVMVERAEVSDRTPGGLYIPETASDSDRPKQGKVVSVGRGHRDKKGRLKPLDVQIGDTVLFSMNSGSEVNMADQSWLLLRENEILAVLK